MRCRLLIPGLLALWLLTGCVSPVIIDRTEDASFKDIDRYVLITPDTDQNALSLDGQRIQKALRETLGTHGLTESPDSADIQVKYDFEPVDRFITTGWQFGAGYWYRNWGINSSMPMEGEITREYRIQVTLVDASNQHVLWQATSRDTINPDSNSEKRLAYIHKVINAMFVDFPSR